mgnify:FL=1
MKRISVELVPRDALREELAVLKEGGFAIDLINIPDLLRFPTRSWEGAALAQQYFPTAMPHIRAMDVDLERPLSMGEYLRQNQIKEVLIIEGDPPQDMTHTVYPTVTTDVIRKFREELPEIRVYAGIDQYRGSMQQEQYRIRRKLQAGAAGFFTQPFFDLRLLAMYADMLEGLEVYWGGSPVESERAKSYWELKNHVVFPKNFAATLAWSVEFAREVQAFAQSRGDSVYLMPIRTDLTAYLTGVFA